VGVLASVLVLLVAALHGYFLVLEMFFWRTDFGRKVFATTPEFAEASAPLAANQGLYNGFLAAGLVVGLLEPNPTGRVIKVFVLACVIVAGVFGAATVSRRIILIQGLPAVLALLAVVAS
jgi:putative membrane protein